MLLEDTAIESYLTLPHAPISASKVSWFSLESHWNLQELRQTGMLAHPVGVTGRAGAEQSDDMRTSVKQIHEEELE
ncbi:hypothetical protein Y032_0606g585 [Ancylostoma ceylanicum]|uniref:Uncharacterized protein n=1 Tax=Ancylostoma ceylanicum TaxID=53326 RepID=A0A016WNK7_9BILA|nr:hypothetical protein Y032_0606g585 [Ancylostoma ceylanicum]